MMHYTGLRSTSKLFKDHSKVLRAGFHCRSTLLKAIPFNMPAMSPTMTEGNIASWKFNEGDTFVTGDVLLEIETDKATIDVEAPEDGILAKILHTPKSGKIAVGDAIAFLAEEGDDLKTLEYPDISNAAPQEAPKQESAPAPAEKPTSAQPVAPKVEAGAEHHRKPKFTQYAPSVVHLIHNHHIQNPESIQATGPQGRLTKGDVLKHLGLIKADPAAPPQPKKAEAPKAQAQVQAQPATSEYTDIPATNMRKVIARRLTESKSTVPHSYIAKEITMDNISALRSKLKNKHGIKVSVNDFIIRATGLALRDVPAVNVRFNPETEDGIEFIPEVDISIAVATPTGLITPIVKNADQQGLLNISTQVKDLANRAKINKLKPEEYQGGSFSISNLGMFDIHNFTAIINPPQACILAVGSSRKVPLTTPYVDEDVEISVNNDALFSELLGVAPVSAPKVTGAVKSASKDLLDELLEIPTSPSQPAFETKTVMTVNLSIDERAVDSHAAAEFLNRLAFYLEDPELLSL